MRNTVNYFPRCHNKYVNQNTAKTFYHLRLIGRITLLWPFNDNVFTTVNHKFNTNYTKLTICALKTTRFFLTMNDKFSYTSKQYFFNIHIQNYGLG